MYVGMWEDSVAHSKGQAITAQKGTGIMGGGGGGGGVPGLLVDEL